MKPSPYIDTHCPIENAYKPDEKITFNNPKGPITLLFRIDKSTQCILDAKWSASQSDTNKEKWANLCENCIGKNWESIKKELTNTDTIPD